MAQVFSISGFEMSEVHKALKRIAENGQVMIGQVEKWADSQLFMQAGELLTIIQSNADSSVGHSKRKKNKEQCYHNSLTIGDPYYYKGTRSIRVYAARPAYHANLIEYGHRVGKKGQTLDKPAKVNKRTAESVKLNVAGKYVFADARKSFESEFTDTIENKFAEAMEKLIQ